MRVSQNGVNSLLVTWTPSIGSDVTGYTIFYQEQGGTQSGSETVGKSSTSAIITGLNTGAIFSVSVSANSNTLRSARIYGPNVTIHGQGIIMCDNVYCTGVL